MTRDEALELLRQHPKNRNPIKLCLSIKDNIMAVPCSGVTIPSPGFWRESFTASITK